MEKFDAIIVGSGACGGWACMALAQEGFKIAMIEAGSKIDPFKAFKHTWPYELDFRGAGQPGFLHKYFKNSTEYNFVELDPVIEDKWGIPVLKIHCTHSNNDKALYQDFFNRSHELFHAAHGEANPSKPHLAPPGSLFHEVGSCRMGANPKTSVLNSFCQTHDIPNLFVFGGGCFVTTGDKHPTLTMMALTARGCDPIIDLAHKKEI